MFNFEEKSNQNVLYIALKVPFEVDDKRQRHGVIKENLLIMKIFSPVKRGKERAKEFDLCRIKYIGTIIFCNKKIFRKASLINQENSF